MSDKSRRKRPSPKAATKKRLDQRSDPKSSRYKIRRKIPAPSIHKPEGADKLKDEQLAMPFVASNRIEAQPFLKWAGGKGSLIGQLEEFFPQDIDRYIEPFLGGGAVFFHLKHRFPDLRPHLRDSNKELINCFRVVRDRPEELMQLLDEHTRGFGRSGVATLNGSFEGRTPNPFTGSTVLLVSRHDHRIVHWEYEPGNGTGILPVRFLSNRRDAGATTGFTEQKHAPAPGQERAAQNGKPIEKCSVPAGS